MAAKKPRITRRHVGPNIVRAWFDTVINPVLRGIRYELELIDKKDWTWRFQPGRLEAILRVRDYITVDAQENFDDFLSSHPRISFDVRIHDERVQWLGTQCFQHLQPEIVKALKENKLCEKLIAAESLAKSEEAFEDPFGGGPKFLREYLLAQYIINNTGELPSYYTGSELWNRHRDELLSVLNEPSVKKAYRGTLDAAAELGKADTKLDRELTEIRERLSRQHDVPFASPRALLA